MKSLRDTERAVSAYLESLTGEAPKLARWPGPKDLPFYLTDAYELRLARVLGQDLVLMFPAERTDLSPMTLRKHWQQLSQRTELPVCVVADALASYERRELVRHRVPFIATNRQLFLLPLGIDFREHYMTASKRIAEPLQPSAQLILLAYLYEPSKLHGAHAAVLAEQTGYSNMTVGRAFRQLEQLGLVKLEKVGREKRLHVDAPPNELWTKARPYLKSPVAKTVYGVAKKPWTAGAKFFECGESALAAETMLVEPSLPHLAVYEGNWPKARKAMQFEERPSAGFAELAVEVWRYDPGVLTKDNRVDPASLLLSLEDNEDERVSIALEELEARIPWLR